MPCCNDEATITDLIDAAAMVSAVPLVVITTRSAASPCPETAGKRGVPVTYVTELQGGVPLTFVPGLPTPTPILLSRVWTTPQNADCLAWT